MAFFTIRYSCPVHGTRRERVTEGQRNTAVKYGYDCLSCGAVCTATEVGDPDDALSVSRRTRPDGPARDRLIRAGAIRSVIREHSTS